MKETKKKKDIIEVLLTDPKAGIILLKRVLIVMAVLVFLVFLDLFFYLQLNVKAGPNRNVVILLTSIMTTILTVVMTMAKATIIALPIVANIFLVVFWVLILTKLSKKHR